MTPVPDQSLSRADTWIFDLDNTLYPAACNLFAQVDWRMTAFIAQTLNLDRDAARALQKRYFREHGTTLAGLMANDAVDPHAFLAYVHDIDVTPVPPSPDLDAALSALPARKVVFTNGSVRHAETVLSRLGVRHHFPEIFDIVAADFVPKPARSTYDRMLAAHAIDPTRAVMVEDLPQNLVPAHALGMRTVLVQGIGDSVVASAESVDRHRDSIHHVTDDLAAFLAAVPSAIG